MSANLTLTKIREYFYSYEYERGMSYYVSGRVRNMEAVLQPGTGKIDVSCCVKGTSLYDVNFTVDANGDIYTANCDCPAFERENSCKHCAAAMIAYVRDVQKGLSANHRIPAAAKASKSDAYAKKLLQSYVNKTQVRTAAPDKPAHISAQLNYSTVMDDKNSYPTFSFRVGYDKLYIVKNVYEFLMNVKNGAVTSYGKNLTLDHRIENFDELSQNMIHLMMNEFSQFRSAYESAYSFYNSFYTNNYNRGINEKNKLRFTGDAFDRWFDLLYEKSGFVDSDGTVKLTKKDPDVSLEIKSDGEGARLNIKAASYSFFGSSKTLYALTRNELTRTSDEFREKIYPLLSAGSKNMHIGLEDLPTFCGCVLPEIAEHVQIDDPDGLLENYTPDECTPCFYFDSEDDTLSLRIEFRYGEQSIEPDAPAEKSTGIRRNIREESAAAALADSYFEKSFGKYYLRDTRTDAVIDFLSEKVDAFRRVGDVYLDERLARMQVHPAPATVGLSVSDGILTLSLDTGGFPPEELAALYQSMLQRRRYHKLADGRYLRLDGSSCEKVAEMAQMLQLTKRELKNGEIKLPAFRAPYLDTVLAGSEGINVKRDAQFRQMVRAFKSVAESDYTVPESVMAELRPYQQTGYQWLKTLEGYGFGGILADEMGLGKTLQMIAFLASATKDRTGLVSLVVCPASLIYNWGEEMQRFAPTLRYRLILGSAAERRALREGAEDCDVWVTSYELLRQDIEDYAERKFYACILDEAQHIKNVSTLASKAVKRIDCRQRFVLTGTPIENRLSELWNLFDFLMPGYLYTSGAFRDKLEKPIVKSKNEEAALQLRRLVQPFLLRRLKSDVLKELPPKEEHVRRISLSEDEKKLYHACAQAALENLDGQGKLQILAALTKLRQVCCDANLCFENYAGPTSKLDACMEICEEMVENGHQILLFSQFTSMLDILRTRLDAAHISNCTIQGSTSKEQRAALVKAFNAGGASVFLISLKAGGTGLNLTAADVVIHFDPWWNQAAQDQATDRAHRIGQMSNVQVYKLIAKDTIEEKILELQEKKAALLDTVAAGESSGILDMSADELLELLKI